MMLSPLGHRLVEAPIAAKVTRPGTSAFTKGLGIIMPRPCSCRALSWPQAAVDALLTVNVM
jgi:hypothetical protein